MKTLITIIFSFTFSFCLQAQNCDSIKAKKYLDQLFNDRQFVSYDSTKFGSYSGQLVLINTPMLNSHLHDYCFYTTTFYSQHFEYINVETILAFKSGLLNPVIIHSPIFTEIPKHFFEIFYGVEILDTTDQVAFANEVVTMLLKITYQGQTKRVLNNSKLDFISFELWHMDLSRGIYDFNFNDKGILTNISIQKGTGRGKVKEGYSRL